MDAEKFFMTVLLVFGLTLLAGCALNAPAGTASISEQEAREIAEGALAALNAGDYEAFSANFSEVMREAMDEDSFRQLRDTLQETSGTYLSLSGPKLVKASTPNAVGYVYECEFEKEEVVMTHYYFVGGHQVEGFFLTSPNLRKISQ